jgi:NAD(P)-dependent dehydrogenase (short-subunit alcohol dehydrogenase family)
MIDAQIEGKVVLISGANHGIGAAAAKAFAAQGAKVFITFFGGLREYSSSDLEKAKDSGVGGDWRMRQ